MAIDERARYELCQRLEEHLGAAASTLMEHLPPASWADVASAAVAAAFSAIGLR